MIARRVLLALWAALAGQFLGRLVDLRWHLAHEEFEGTAEQLEAHWLIWLAVLATIAVAVAGLHALPDRPGRSGLILVVGAGAVYVAVAIWHFVEHANGADPELAHVLLALSEVAMFAGAAFATMRARRSTPEPPSPGGANHVYPRRRAGVR
jgi:hypothetical protein